MGKSIDDMTEAEVRAYAKELEIRLRAYEQPRYVYFLLDAEAGVVKIGQSANVAERVRVLSREVGRPLELLGVVPGDKHTKRQIKQQFRALVKADEWYIASPELVAFINENVREYRIESDGI